MSILEQQQDFSLHFILVDLFDCERERLENEDELLVHEVEGFNMEGLPKQLNPVLDEVWVLPSYELVVTEHIDVAQVLGDPVLGGLTLVRAENGVRNYGQPMSTNIISERWYFLIGSFLTCCRESYMMASTACDCV